MKVLHISTYDTGGAAKAAIRLHQGLLKLGVKSSFLSLYSSNVKFEKKYQHCYTIKEKAFEYARIKWGLGNSRVEEQVYRQRTRSSLEVATLLKTNFDITQQKVYKDADIINLHWTSSYLDYPSFWKKNLKPTVWTLHDMNPFCGIYHYRGDAIRNNEQLGELDCATKKAKCKLYQRAEISIVCPSRWLLNCSQSSKLFRHFPHYHIPYSLDTTVFKLQKQREAREELSLPQDKKILLFVSQNVANYRKGYDLLLEAVSQIKNSTSVQAVAIGNPPQNKCKDITYLGSVEEEKKMAQAYAAADAFVMPSREDNLPNVMLESLACGTPVISFPIGGALDIIESGRNGWLTSEVSAEALAQAIQEWYRSPSPLNRNAISCKAGKHFALTTQARSYEDLYRNLLSKTKL